MKTTLLCIAAWQLALCALAGEASFSAKPSAAKDGEKVKISFTVSAPTDVEVAVLGADGKVVRHLAAGVLGAKNPPPEPLKAGLSQSLEWDGQDDFGKPAAGGPFKVRVRAGTGVKFGRFIGDSPYCASTLAIACDEDGNVYVQYDQGSLHVRVFDSEGRYLRELLPFPADLPPEAMKEVARGDAQAQAFHPQNLYALWPSFYQVGGGARMVHASTKTGVLMADERKLYRLDARGGVAGGSLGSHDMWGGVNKPGFPNVGGGGVWAALSADGKYAYLSGPFTGKFKDSPYPFSPEAPPGRVYRAAMDGKDTWKEFATIKGTWDAQGAGGNYTKHMGYWDVYWGPRSPVQGVTVDDKGRVFVCDRENGRVVAFDENGKEIDEVTVPYAEQVAVHPKTGAIYVMQKDRTGYGEAHAMLFKFDKLGKDLKPAATYKFSKQTRRPQMALSAGKDRIRIWVAGVPEGMVALEDKGTTFEPAKTSFQPPAESPSGWIRFAVDPGRDEVYAEDGGGLFYRWDGQTGNGGLLKKDGKPFYATDLAVGYDGLLYFQTDKGFSGPLGRYTRDLQPAPYPSGTHVLTPYIYGRWGHGMNCEKGLGIGPHGEVYISFMYSWCRYLVGGFGPDGKPMNGLYLKGRFQAENYKQGQPKDLDSGVIGPIPAASGGVCVDLAGNIYTGICALPEGHVPPAGFEKEPAYAVVGSVIRFSPKGGAILGIEHAESKQPDAPRIALSKKMDAENATKVYAGIAPFSGNWGSTSDCCVCRVPRFGLDRYGRLYLPNAVTNSVRMVDNNDNLIVEFGKYGNLDSQYVNPNTEAGKAGKPTVAVPEIPLAWPTGAGASENHVYVNDSYNNRAVRADLTYGAEETCAVK